MAPGLSADLWAPAAYCRQNSATSLSSSVWREKDWSVLLNIYFHQAQHRAVDSELQIVRHPGVEDARKYFGFMDLAENV